MKLMKKCFNIVYVSIGFEPRYFTKHATFNFLKHDRVSQVGRAAGPGPGPNFISQAPNPRYKQGCSRGHTVPYAVWSQLNFRSVRMATGVSCCMRYAVLQVSRTEKIPYDS